MGIAEAAKCAEMVGVKHNIPYHNTNSNRGEMLDRDLAERFALPNHLNIYPSDKLKLR